MQLSKNEERKHRKVRIRKKVIGTEERPRLVVFRSNLHIYAQIVDDAEGVTLASSSTLVLSKKGDKCASNVEGGKKVGLDVARAAMEKGIKSVVFDRNGYLYHGKVKAVAEGAREGGLVF